MNKLVEYYKDNYGLDEDNDEVRCMEMNNKILWRLLVLSTAVNIALILWKGAK